MRKSWFLFVMMLSLSIYAQESGMPKEISLSGEMDVNSLVTIPIIPTASEAWFEQGNPEFSSMYCGLPVITSVVKLHYDFTLAWKERKYYTVKEGKVEFNVYPSSLTGATGAKKLLEDVKVSLTPSDYAPSTAYDKSKKIIYLAFQVRKPIPDGFEYGYMARDREGSGYIGYRDLSLLVDLKKPQYLLPDPVDGIPSPQFIGYKAELSQVTYWNNYGEVDKIYEKVGEGLARKKERGR